MHTLIMHNEVEKMIKKGKPSEEQDFDGFLNRFLADYTDKMVEFSDK